MSTGSEALPGARLHLEMPRARGRRANGFVISAFACAAISGALLLYCDALLHWFIIPVFLCGVLIGRDAVDWLRGRVDVFDPIGIIGLFGVHFFFAAPVLHVILDYWMAYVTPPPDWRDWLGGMAVLNLLGLSAYRVVVRRRSRPLKPQQTVWLLRRRTYPVLLVAILLIACALQAWVYARFGGILGYIQSYVAREGAFEGMGWLFTISESLPIVALMGFATIARNRPILSRWSILCLVLILFLGVQMLFGGLRGSRANTIWALFWAVGIVHVVVRPFPRKAICAGLGFIIIFMYVYGFYKAAGLDALLAIRDSEARGEIEHRSGRTVEAALLGDLGRSDVQAYVLYKLWPTPADYEYAWGRTYIGAASLLIPSALWPDRPPTKVKEGTEALYGIGSYAPRTFQSSRVYGLSGEAMLNWGPLAVPFVFVLFGLMVRRVRDWGASLVPGDLRVMLYPMLVNLCLIVLVSDSDNVVFFVVKHATVPFLLVLGGSRAIHRWKLEVAEGRTLRTDVPTAI